MTAFDEITNIAFRMTQEQRARVLFYCIGRMCLDFDAEDVQYFREESYKE